MKKSKGILTLVLTLVIMAALGYVAVFGIGTEKAGAASEIKQGLDLAGGVSITYQVVGGPYRPARQQHPYLQARCCRRQAARQSSYLKNSLFHLSLYKNSSHCRLRPSAACRMYRLR